MSKMQAATGEVIGSPMNSPLGRKFSLKSKNKHKNNYKNAKKAFSVAEAMIAVLIGSIALGMAAPMITKQIKTQNFTDTQFDVLRRQIEELRESQGVPTGAIMFFDLHRCPDGWDFVGDEYIGDYPRIVGEGNDNEVGEQLEQMVHKHKHISPFMQAITDGDGSNNFRYGPFRVKNGAGLNVYGDADYKVISLLEKGKVYTPSNESSLLFTGYSISVDNNNWYTFTSDGMNRVEKLRAYNGNIASILTCPNRDEGNQICQSGDNSYSFNTRSGYSLEVKNIPLLEDMPLVGDENRPNSVKWLACRKTNN